MSDKKKKRFDKWYADQVKENVHYVLRDELIKYCQSDVRMLAEGCNVFQQRFREEAGFDPMLKNITIASACMRYFRQSCLAKDTIAVRLPKGWMNRNLRTEAQRVSWLSSMNVAWIPTLLGEADWVHAVVNRTVYLFFNCFENGCRMCCFSHWQKNQQHPAVTNREAREALRYKCERLERMGYTVRVMWECEWAEDRENEDDVKYFNPRDAFYGGRTEVVRHYVNLDEEEDTGQEIRYVDLVG